MIQNFSVAYNYFYLGIEKLNNLSHFFSEQKFHFFFKIQPIVQLLPSESSNPQLDFRKEKFLLLKMRTYMADMPKIFK